MNRHPDDCLGCAINRIIRRLAKDQVGPDRPQAAAELRKFGRVVAHEVRKEMERRHAQS